MQELQNQAESMIANQVKKVLLGTKQYNDAAVTSHLSMDFSDYKETVKEYYANSGRDEGMLSHEETYESENTNDGGGCSGYHLQWGKRENHLCIPRTAITALPRLLRPAGIICRMSPLPIR